MFPKLYERCDVPSKSDFNDTYEALLTILSNFECKSHFDGLLDGSQPVQKVIVDKFKNDLCHYLEQELPNLQWRTEFPSSKLVRDSIDIFGERDDCCIIIEIDKHRADQVAKKYISRTAVVDRKNIYIAMCYPGTSSMNSNECKKYFNYCKIISLKLNNLFAGYIIVKR